MKQHPFSTRRGRKVRLLKLKANPLCERCEKGGLVVIATEVHHIKPWAQHPDLAFVEDNLESLCEPCHDKSKGAGLGNVGGCGVNGMPISALHPWQQSRVQKQIANKPEITIVCGPPGSGKTTYVQQHCRPGDLVLDLDTIWQALTGMDLYQKPDSIAPFVYEARDAILRRLDRPHDVKRVWIIKAAPKAQDREALCSRFNAQALVLLTSESECSRRIADRQDKGKWQRIIREWWAEYEPRAADTITDA